MEAQIQPIPYGLKIFFDDGTVVNWYKDGRRKSVHAEKNPAGYDFPSSDPDGEAILRAMDRSHDGPLRRALGLPMEPPPDSRSAKRPEAGFDGGCSPNPGPGGWGVVLPDGSELFGGELATTNNRMELLGAIRALEVTEGPIHVVGDSAYVINGIQKWVPAWIARGWVKADGEPVLNVDLWRRLASLAEGRDLTWEQVRGHQGHVLNERCHQLAVKGRESVLGRGPKRRRSR